MHIGVGVGEVQVIIGRGSAAVERCFLQGLVDATRYLAIAKAGREL